MILSISRTYCTSGSVTVPIKRCPQLFRLSVVRNLFFMNMCMSRLIRVQRGNCIHLSDLEVPMPSPLRVPPFSSTSPFKLSTLEWYSSVGLLKSLRHKCLMYGVLLHTFARSPTIISVSTTRVRQALLSRKFSFSSKFLSPIITTQRRSWFVCHQVSVPNAVSLYVFIARGDSATYTHPSL